MFQRAGRGLDTGFTPSCGSMDAGKLVPPLKEIAMKRLTALMLLALLSMSTLTACNTMAGVGKDVEGAGDKLEDKAEDCKDNNC